MRPKKHHISFIHAWDGIIYAFKTQPNFAIHVFISLLVIVAGIFLGLSAGEWTLIGLIIAVGLVIELINTAVESTVDLITRKYHPLAKVAKDTASGAMLIYAIGAAVVGLLIFIPKLWRFF